MPRQKRLLYIYTVYYLTIIFLKYTSVIVGKKIGICNFKGGVGKTVIAINLSYTLSQLPSTVMLIDLDPQMNSVTGLGISKKDIMTTPKINITETLQLSTNINNISNQYDYIIFDLPPKDLNIMDNITQICDQLIIPVIPDFFSLEGLAQILNFIKTKQTEYNKNNTINILINQYEGNKISVDICTEINKYFPDTTLFSIIPKDDNIKLAISAGKPIIEYNALSASAIAFIMLSKEIKNGRGKVW